MNIRARRRLTALAMLLLAAVTGVALFWTAQRVQTADVRLRRLQEATTGEKESIRVLRAEWDYLNRPDRLEALARTQLNMGPPGTGAVARSAASLPVREKTAAKPPSEAAVMTAPTPRIAVPVKPAPPAPTAADQRSFNELLDAIDKQDSSRAGAPR